jgi:hypothetical protein
MDIPKINPTTPPVFAPFVPVVEAVVASVVRPPSTVVSDLYCRYKVIALVGSP